MRSPILEQAVVVVCKELLALRILLSGARVKTKVKFLIELAKEGWRSGPLF